MKNLLTPEQSAELIKHGVSSDKACMVCMDFNGTYAYVSGEESQTVRDCVNDQLYVEESRVFSISDLLSLLPKEIHGGNYILEMLADNAGWEVCYRYDKNVIVSVADKEDLIDALYDALVWCIDNNHVKLD